MELLHIYLYTMFFSHMFTLGVLYHILTEGGPKKVFIELITRSPKVTEEMAAIIRIGAIVNLTLFTVLYTVSAYKK